MSQHPKLIDNMSHWKWCLKKRNEYPEAMAFATRLANLLEPQLRNDEDLRDTLRKIIRPTLRKAGIDQVDPLHRQRAFLRLNQCFEYGVVLGEVLHEAGYEY